jgi:hypothetical protein
LAKDSVTRHNNKLRTAQLSLETVNQPSLLASNKSVPVATANPLASRYRRRNRLPDRRQCGRELFFRSTRWD